MINLDVLGGVNFKKGCYTGQEIVARMHYLGKLKQRMFVCHLAGKESSMPKVGDKVFLNLGKDEMKSAGNIVSFNITEQIALAVLRLEMLESHDRFSLESGAELIVKDKQPYDLQL